MLPVEAFAQKRLATAASAVVQILRKIGSLSEYHYGQNGEADHQHPNTSS
jgi:hypothetical protein